MSRLSVVILFVWVKDLLLAKSRKTEINERWFAIQVSIRHLSFIYVLVSSMCHRGDVLLSFEERKEK